MNELALFAGAGGGILGGHLLGWRTVCAVEFDAYARNVLLARQRDGWLPRFPIWDDVRTFDGRPWRGHVDVVSGGFPCQDISCAGKGAGIEGERSGLWKHMARIVGEVRPRFVWVENSPMLVQRGLAVVLGDLAALGYDARWGVVGAHHAGAPHKRDRIWVLADAEHNRIGRRQQQQERGQGERDVADAEGWKGDIGGRGDLDESEQGRQSCDASVGSCGQDLADPMRLGSSAGIPESTQWKERIATKPVNSGAGRTVPCDWWEFEPSVGRVAHGVAPRLDVHGAHAGINVGRVATGIPKRVHRLRCIGNGQVPAAMIQAWKELAQQPPTE